MVEELTGTRSKRYSEDVPLGDVLDFRGTGPQLIRSLYGGFRDPQNNGRLQKRLGSVVKVERCLDRGPWLVLLSQRS